MRRILMHIGISLVALFVFLGIPFLVYYDNLISLGNNTVTADASVINPTSPSGDYYVYIKEENHLSYLEDWIGFFQGENDGLDIFEDISCMTVTGDTTGLDVAKSYQALLASNQMELKSDIGMLVVSKIEKGLIDVAIVSSDAKSSYGILDDISGLTIIRCEG